MTTKTEPIRKMHQGAHFTHVSTGNPAEVADKLFLKDALGTTATEISFGALPSGQSIPFFHTHKQNEEVYIILSGSGRFQVDNDLFVIEPGSVIRVSTAGIRSLQCTSDEPLRYLCIQAKTNSLEQCTMTDGVIVEHDALWD